MNDLFNPNRFSDSAGRPWDGRAFEENPFSKDDGKAPAELMKVLASFRAGEAGSEKVIDTIRFSRLLVPLLAALGESEVGAHGQLVDKSAELSIVTVKSPDDQDSLVVFSSVEAMSRWNPSARPVPTDAIRVALAAASQLAYRVVLDPGSETEFVIRRPAIAAIAQSLEWLPPEKSEAVAKVVRNSLSDEERVLEFSLASGDPNSLLRGSELEVTLTIQAGLDSESVRELVDRISRRWAESEEFVRLVDSVGIKLKS